MRETNGNNDHRACRDEEPAQRRVAEALRQGPDDEAGEVPKAVVVLKTEADKNSILDFVAERVAPHKRIRYLEFVEQIPKSPSGKILRRVLVEKERAKLAAG